MRRLVTESALGDLAQAARFSQASSALRAPQASAVGASGVLSGMEVAASARGTISVLRTPRPSFPFLARRPSSPLRPPCIAPCNQRAHGRSEAYSRSRVRTLPRWCSSSCSGWPWRAAVEGSRATEVRQKCFGSSRSPSARRHTVVPQSPPSPGSQSCSSGPARSSIFVWHREGRTMPSARAPDARTPEPASSQRHGPAPQAAPHAPNSRHGFLLGALAGPQVNLVALLPPRHDGAANLVLVLAKLVANHEQHLERKEKVGAEVRNGEETSSACEAWQRKTHGPLPPRAGRASLPPVSPPLPYRLEPVVGGLAGRAARQLAHPLATLFVLLVLPHGRDALLQRGKNKARARVCEGTALSRQTLAVAALRVLTPYQKEVQVAALQPVYCGDVVVQGPKVLHGAKGVDLRRRRGGGLLPMGNGQGGRPSWCTGPGFPTARARFPSTVHRHTDGEPRVHRARTQTQRGARQTGPDQRDTALQGRLHAPPSRCPSSPGRWRCGRACWGRQTTASTPAPAGA